MKQPTNEMQRAIDWMKKAKGFEWKSHGNWESQLACFYQEVEEVTEATSSSASNDDELAKELTDVIFTCTVLLGQMGYDPQKCLQLINDENFTKFINGKPIIDQHGKVTKGPNHVKCDISKARVN